MNLYQINFEHYSQKDSEKGIYTYLVADNDEAVYEWIKSEPVVNDSTLWNSYKDNENDGTEYDIYNDDYETVGVETFKERILRFKGEMYDDDVELDDLYYGKTLIGWNFIQEEVDIEEVYIAKNIGIAIEIIE